MGWVRVIRQDMIPVSMYEFYWSMYTDLYSREDVESAIDREQKKLYFTESDKAWYKPMERFL